MRWPFVKPVVEMRAPVWVEGVVFHGEVEKGWGFTKSAHCPQRWNHSHLWRSRRPGSNHEHPSFVTTPLTLVTSTQFLPATMEASVIQLRPALSACRSTRPATSICAACASSTSSSRRFSALNRPPPNYPAHVPLNRVERAALAVGSGVMSLINPYRHGTLPLPPSNLPQLTIPRR